MKNLENDNFSRLAKSLEAFEKEFGVGRLGQVLSECLCAVSARYSSDNPQIWNIDTPFVEGEIHVVFAPGQSVLDASFQKDD